MPARTIQYDGNPSALVKALPHYGKVTKGEKSQRAFRLKIERRCQTDLAFREKIIQACRDDPLFFINCFAYIVEPRRAKTLPFNTWPHQDTVIAEMHAGWSREDYVGKKSREQGASWIMAALFVWAFVFLKNQALGFGSKDEDTADDHTDLGSFGAKIDYLLERLPRWMIANDAGTGPRFRRNLSKHTWRRIDRCGNHIKGFAATAGIARGGRFTVFFLDEAAFFEPGSDYEADANLQRVTDCAIWWSTPNGFNNAFADKVLGDNNWTLLVLSFLDNPAHNKGRYRTTAGQLDILDGKHVEGYQYELDGRERTFWLDRQWLRAGRDLLWLDQELYMNFGGSKGRPFPAVILDRARKQERNPITTGMLLFNEEDPTDIKQMQWIPGEAYKFDLWRPVDAYGRVMVSQPIMGGDLSWGNSGDMSSNSVLSIWDGADGQQIGELAINSLPPIDFAKLAVAVCYWLSPVGKTFFVWEKNGPGSPFTDEMMKLNYPNVYLSEGGGDEQRYYAKKSDRPGYFTSKTSAALNPLLAALTNGTICPRSRSLLAECGEYEITDNQKWIHPRSVNSRDSSAKGEGHGDRAIAAAMACRGMRERRAKQPQATSSAQNNSLAGRMAQQAERLHMARLEDCRF